MGEQPKVNRRTILRAGAFAAAVGLVLGLEGAETDLPWDAQPVGGNPKLNLAPKPSFTKAIHRRADQLSIRLDFYNLTLLKAGQPGPGDPAEARLVKLDPAADAFIVVDFGPQHLAEHAYQDSPLEPFIAPAPSMLAGSSRLAFKAPGAPFPYTFGTLMAWEELLPSVAPHAVGNAVVRAPLPTETAIEVPWKVVLSPDATPQWTHPVEPLPASGGRSVLWHARLDPGAKLRVVWTPDLNSPQIGSDPVPPGTTSLTPNDRRDLVRLSAKWDQFSSGEVYVPQPVEAEQLMLSPLGAWLKADGVWKTRPDGVNLEGWQHLATMGRDHFVKVVYVGRLWPIRHQVVLIKITERKFETVGPKPTALLRQRFFIIPRERVQTYAEGDIDFAPYGLRDIPFKKIRILTPTTPNLAIFEGPLAEPNTQIPRPNQPGVFFGIDAFWPTVGAPGNWADFLWDLEVEDYEGRVNQLRMPLMYVSDGTSRSPSVNALKTYYETAIPATRRTADLAGQKVSLAHFDGGDPGETAYPLDAFTFGANTFTVAPTTPGHMPWDFTPRMIEGTARLDAVDRIRGGTGTTPQKIILHPVWISDGDDVSANPGQVFAALDSPVSMSYKTSSTGGIAAPDMNINALSALTGPVDAPNVDTTVPAKFKPMDFFGGTDPKLLGHIKLKELLTEVDFPAPGSMSATSEGASPIPRLVTTEIVEGNQVVGVHTALSWETTQMIPIPGLFVNEMEGSPGTPTKLSLSAQTDAYFDGRPPKTIVQGDLTNFTVVAVGPVEVIHLLFNRFGFISQDGSKPDILVSIHDVKFVGALEFVNVLREFMGGNGIGGNQAALAAQETPENGGYVNLTPSGVEAGYNLTLPPVATGALLLENISFGARASLFFDGRPMQMRFNFAERERPFTLTVMCFGGGGCVAVTLSLEGFELFEMTLEFGAKLALDIGVASGSISAMAGIYLAIGDNNGDSNDDGVKLTGYLRLNGELNILGIIRLAIEFYLAFTYLSGPPEEVYGEASVTIEIEVLFFSASVTLGPIKKTFAGGDGGQSNAMSIAGSTPKSFAEMVPTNSMWDEYTAMYDPAAF